MDERRLYEVGAGGTPWTIQEDPEARARRLNRLRWMFALGIAANGATWTLAGAALVLGGRAWGAAFGVLALLTAPLLMLPALVEARARWRARRRHRTRPERFPGA
ncbi:hypothetical protein [Falsiroseomonas oryzae]|uniref:hypothetical protein n=1 Tax=Falsiroseomonas oryzae TaxID=2766473 RepID=UPI0022EB2919|nr:hypothetical protein [Roseomonas sp. MO-31]